MAAVFKKAVPYADDVLNLPVADVEASIPYYERTFGLRVVSREETPHRRAVLARDNVQIGLAENGGDSSQEGAYFEVDDLDAAFEEIKGRKPADGDTRIDKHGEATLRVFFVVAPDGLCYMIGQRQP